MTNFKMMAVAAKIKPISIGTGICLLMLMALETRARAAERIEITAGYVQFLETVPDVATVAIGDPSIADATLSDGKLVIITAKKVGQTNIMAFNKDGKLLISSDVHIFPVDRRPKFSVRVTSGVSKEDKEYTCGPSPGCKLKTEDNPGIQSSPTYTTVINTPQGTASGTSTSATTVGSQPP